MTLDTLAWQSGGYPASNGADPPLPEGSNTRPHSISITVDGTPQILAPVIPRHGIVNRDGSSIDTARWIDPASEGIPQNLSLENDRGERPLQGTAIVELPLRNS